MTLNLVSFLSLEICSFTFIRPIRLRGGYVIPPLLAYRSSLSD